MTRVCRAWTYAEVARLRDLRAAGVPVRECARRLGRTAGGVHRAACRHGLTRRVPRPPRPEIAGRVADGLTAVEIAREYGVHPETARDWCRVYGVRLRRGFARDEGFRARLLRLVAAGCDTTPALVRAVGRCHSLVSERVRELVAAGLLRRVVTGRPGRGGRAVRYEVTRKWARDREDAT